MKFDFQLMRGDSVEEILRTLEYKNSTIRVINSEKYPMVRVMAYMPLAEFSFGLFYEVNWFIWWSIEKYVGE